MVRCFSAYAAGVFMFTVGLLLTLTGLTLFVLWCKVEPGDKDDQDAIVDKNAGNVSN